MFCYKDSTFKLKVFFHFLLFWFITASVHASNPIAQKADFALKNQDYTEAIQLYRESAVKGNVSPAMYFNMAIAEYQQGNTAEAIISIQKALKLNPGDKRVSALYQNILNDHAAIEPPAPDFFIARYWKSVSGMFMPQTWMWISILALTLTGYLFYRYYFAQTKFPKVKYALLLSATLFILFSLFGISRNNQVFHNKTIVITASDATLKVAPDDESPDLTPLTSGSVVYYIRNIAGWWQVRTVYGDEGWIEATQGTRI